MMALSTMDYTGITRDYTLDASECRRIYLVA